MMPLMGEGSIAALKLKSKESLFLFFMKIGIVVGCMSDRVLLVTSRLSGPGYTNGPISPSVLPYACVYKLSWPYRLACSHEMGHDG